MNEANDRQLRSQLKNIAYREVGSSRLSDYARNRISVIDASFVLAMAQPVIRRFEGCILVDDLFDLSAYESWRNAFGDDKSSIEYYCNMIRIDSIIGSVNEDMALGFSMLLRNNWTVFLSSQLEGRFEVHLLTDDIGQPSITFNLNRP